jgi:hypothetical protein
LPVLGPQPVAAPGAGTAERSPLEAGQTETVPLGQRAAVRRDLTAALVTLGVTLDEGNLLAAQALVRFGVPLTAENLGDVRRGLASHVVRQPETVALAKSLDLPLSPAILRALDTLLSARTGTSLLTITVPVRPDPGAIAAHLQMAARAATRSVENKLRTGDIDGARSDLRSYLLRRALAGDADAETAARHLEGQMLTNAARGSESGAENGGVLVAFVAATNGRAHPVEMHVQPGAAEDDEEPGELSAGKAVGATLHLPTAHLGVVTARLHLASDGRLSCRLSTSDEAASRRIERSIGHLNDALLRAGFPPPTVQAKHEEAAPEPPSGITPRARATRPLCALDLRA